MLFLQSLFCWVGADNRNRFSLIVASSHLFFIVFSAVFHSSIILSCFILLLSTIALTCTTKRRLNDAKLTKNWLYTPTISFAIIGLIIISFNYQPLYWLTIFPAALSSILLTYPGKNKRQYHYGYAGPINLTPDLSSTSRNQRIEPTLSAQHANLNSEDVNPFNHHNHHSVEGSFYNNEANDNYSTQDIGELIREKLLNNQNSKFVILGVLTIIFVAILISFILSFISKNQPSVSEQENQIKEESSQMAMIARNNKVTLPDDFSLMTTPFNGLIVHWKADSTKELNLWNISQAIGDKSCQSIKFNNKDSYRTTKVYVENSNEYIAEFSPLDTNNIIKDIALRSNFTLCGYSFSLKGSQATLGKSNFYADLLAQ